MRYTTETIEQMHKLASQGKSIIEIASECSIVLSSAYRLAKIYKIQYKRGHHASCTTFVKRCPDDLLQTYIEQDMPIDKIQKKIGYTLNYTRTRIHSLGYSTYKNGTYKKAKEVDIKQFRKDVIDGYRKADLKKRHEIGIDKINSLLVQLGLTYDNRFHSRRSLIAYLHKITSRQMSIITGLLLGDGSITIRPSKHNTLEGRLQTGHSLPQRAYLEWLRKELLPLTDVAISETFQKFDATSEGNYCYSIISNYHNTLLELRNLWYPKGKKIIPKNIVDMLDPLALAVWFMDDGSISRYWSTIHTQGFTTSDVFLLIDALYRKFDIRSSLVLGEKHDNDKLYPAISISSKESQKLHLLIDPYIHRCVSYKKFPKFDADPRRYSDERFLQRKKIPFTSEELHKLLQMGMSLKNIASKFELTYDIIRYYCRKWSLRISTIKPKHQSPETVNLIRKLSLKGLSRKDIMIETGKPISIIRNILSGKCKCYKYPTEEDRLKHQRYKRHIKFSPTEDVVTAIKVLREEGLSYSKISSKLAIQIWSVRKVLKDSYINKKTQQKI